MKISAPPPERIKEWKRRCENNKIESTPMTDIKTEIILCECYDLNHQMIVTHDTDDNLVYLNVKSNVRGFWYRLKYLLGLTKYDFAELQNQQL